MRTSNRLTLLFTLAVLPLLGACAAPQQHDDWTYEGITGPGHWGHLSPDYVLCVTDKDLRRADRQVLRAHP